MMRVPRHDNRSVNMDAIPANQIAHATYLPFTWKQFASHFTPVTGLGNPLAPYRLSIANYAEFCESAEPPTVPLHAARRLAQIEKDERFWIAAALMAYFYADDRPARLAELLARALGPTPPFGDAELRHWEHCFTETTRLYFEANLPSPKAYKALLKDEIDARHPIPYVRRAASIQKNHEGATHVDALLVDPSTGCSVLFEAKVLSDCSAHVSFDAFRNQLIRNVDVMLEPAGAGPLSGRRPERSAFILVTPRMFRDRPHSRLYGWLMNDYRSNPGSLQWDLPHRKEDWSALAKRMGWLTFEECNEVLPGACRWLTP
jgi:hypothetical protein